MFLFSAFLDEKDDITQPGLLFGATTNLFLLFFPFYIFIR